MGRRSFGSFLDASFMSLDATILEHTSDHLHYTPEVARCKKRKRRFSRGSRERKRVAKPPMSALRDVSNSLHKRTRKRKISCSLVSTSKKQKTEEIVSTLRHLAEDAYKKGDYEEARTNYQHIVQNYPHLKNSLSSNLALCNLFLGNYLEALNILRGSQHLGPQGIFLEAKLMLFQGKISLALPLIERIMQGDMNEVQGNKFELLRHIDFKQEAATLLQSCQKYNTSMASIQKNLKDEDAVEAFQEAKAVAEISPKCLRVWLIKVVSNFLSIALYRSSSGRHVLRKESSSIPVEEVKRINHKNKALQKEVREILKKAEEDNYSIPTISSEIIAYANMFLNQAFLNEAALLLKILLRFKNHSNARVLLEKISQMEEELSSGLDCMANKNFNEAIRHYTNCLEIDKENIKFNARVLYRRAEANLAVAQEKQAIKDYSQCLDILPSYAKAVGKLVQLLVARNRYDEAIGRLESLYKVSRSKELGFEIRKLRILKEKYEFVNARENYKTPPKKHRYNTRLSAKLQRRQRTLYDVLGVRYKASKKSIKRAYKKMALKLHPDKQSCTKKVAAKDLFQELSNAYSILSSPRQRREYDMTLQ